MKVRRLPLLIVSLLFLTVGLQIRAQNPGTLDPSFGTNGMVITDVNNVRNESSSIAIQTNGKIVVGGSGSGFTLMRYNADGTLDASFGTGGIVTSTLTTFGESVNDLAIQSDGKIVVVGQNNNSAAGIWRFIVARYNSDGSLDTSFGPGGFVTTSFGSATHFGNALTIQPDGKIIAAGAAYDTGKPAVFAVARYNPDGSLDPSFGNGGKVTTAFEGSSDGGDQAGSVNLAPGGKIVVAGTRVSSTTFRDFAVARYNSDGSLDATFGSGGKVVTNINGNDIARDSAIQSDGKIILAGSINTLLAFTIVRYSQDGTLDTTFGSGGIVTMPVGTSENYINAVELQSDGKIIAAGESGVFPDRDITLIRYNTDGTVDSSFGINGKVVTAIGNNTFDNVADIVLQPNGRIVIAGGSTQNPTSNFDSVVIRYLNDNFVPTPTPTPTPTPANTAQFSNTVYDIGEGGTSAIATVTRTGDVSAAATVSYATSDSAGSNDCNVLNTGMASSRCDYETTVGTLHFAAGETSQTISVPIVDDSYAEGSENLTLTLSNASGATLGSPSTSTVTITDNETVNGTNPIDQADFFVRQHYIDFLNREPDSSGRAFWVDQITSCGADVACTEVRRINVSAAFFLSIEFQETGYLVERLYKTAYGDATGTSNFGPTHQLSVPIIRLNEFLPDTQQIGKGVVIGQPGADQLLESNKQTFIAEFVQRPRFTTAYPLSMTAAQFVDTLNTNAGGVLSSSQRDQLVGNLTAGTKTRAEVLRAVAEDADLFAAERNRAFVLVQFFGYLRRNPNDAPDSDYSGYDFWLTKLNQFNGNFVNAEMVKAFIVSGEYRGRFGP